MPREVKHVQLWQHATRPWRCPQAWGDETRRRPLKIVVDYELCEANAVCMDVCPECFRVEDDDTLTVLVEEPPESLRAKVEEAVRLCPRQAISLTEG